MTRRNRRTVAEAAVACVLALFAMTTTTSLALAPVAFLGRTARQQRSLSTLYQSSSSATESFIDTELRGAAMRLHTRAQAPKEGEAPAKPERPAYTPTRSDYLQFLVDSLHVYEALEEIVEEKAELSMFRKTGLERTSPLKEDIQFMVDEYGLDRPAVGDYGIAYADALRKMESIPEFMCHYYNFYFAHTAGGRMIGKQMSALLLDKKTLEFYKWDGDLNQIKASVKERIEEMAAAWSPDERNECIDATAAAFSLGGAINAYLSGGASPH